MRSLKKLGITALAASLISVPYLTNAKEGEMFQRVMMYYGGFEVDEMFDARQWFASGQYKPRYTEVDGGASNVTMLRSKPMSFTREQWSELPYAAAEAFDYSHLENIDTQSLVLDPPDLSQRIRYAYSVFAEPNKPEDYYYLYLELASRYFVVTFSRDAQSGGSLTGKYVKEVMGDYASQAEHRQVFAEIEAQERKSR